MFTFNGHKHQGHSICSRKPPSKFVIGAFFRLICRFRSFFFCYLNYFENCWEMFTFNGYKHQGHSMCSRKPPSKFVIGAFFRLICRFRSFFFFVYVNYYEKCWEMFTFKGYKHQGHSVCSRKPPSKFVIGAFFRQVMLFAVFGPFFFVYLNYYENCWEMFFFNGNKHQGHSICSRKPPSMFVIGAFFRQICRFRSFFFVYLNYFENCWEMFTFNGYKHQGHSICSRKPPSKFVIGAFFRLLNYFENCWEMFTFNGYKHQGHSVCSRKPPSKFVIGAFFRLVMLFAVFGHFFFVYLNSYENCWGMFTFNGYKHQGHSICSRKPPSKFVIGAFFRLVMLYKETKKKIFRNL
ncbi:hypothetical protein AGLY_017681 [Aphis glycines]|uniref:Uncharacterized protein n=1 Tax=Aphis glycines TaxID=307491 RepID=A0A6G0SW40_APHGL|nr:hypothetical protein AGLY_017681 [Aphis glycines]